MQRYYAVVLILNQPLKILNPLRRSLAQRHRLFRAPTAASATSKCLLVFYLSLVNVDFMSLAHRSSLSNQAALLLTLPASLQVFRVVHLNCKLDLILGVRWIRQSAVVVLMGI
jgi:hypothetical protein